MNNRTVLCHGVFDLLHPGHIEHLREAREHGDRLVVSITADEFVHKGPGRPIFNENQRASVLKALKPVDDVLICREPSAVSIINDLHPDIYFKGADYAQGEDGAGNLEAERQAVEAYGGRLIFGTTPLMSSTALINQTMPRVSEEAQKALNLFRQKYTGQEILTWLDRAKTLTACAVGESIRDVYIWVAAEGKSTKDSIVTFRETGGEEYPGGIDIIQAHLRQICSQVCPGLLYTSPIVKTRYVERPFMHKVFSIVDRDKLGTHTWDIPAISKSDLTVVADFGHGLFRPDGSNLHMVEESARFLALTVQANSLNWGFNRITKWQRADYVVLDEQELALAAEDKYPHLKSTLLNLKERFKAKAMAVTLGHNGCLVLGDDYIQWPALADKIVDRMGAGDAFLAATAPLAALGAPADVLGFVGNIAGALEVAEIGNVPLDANKLRQWTIALMK